MTGGVASPVPWTTENFTIPKKICDFGHFARYKPPCLAKKTRRFSACLMRLSPLRQFSASVLPRGNRSLSACFVIAVMAALHVGTELRAGEGGAGTQTVAEREVARRSAAAAQAQQLMATGDQARSDKDYAAALDSYKAAYTLLPNAPLFAAQRKQALDRFAETSVLRARQLGEGGRYAEANALLESVLSDAFAPDHAGARKLREQLKDPERFNPALSPKHVENVQEVTRLLILAQGNFDIGEFNQARDTYNQVLSIDPYNQAARRGLEKTEKQITSYLADARNHTRARALREVDAMWEDSLPPQVQINEAATDRGGEAGAASAREKLAQIVIPQVMFSEATLDEVVQFLTLKSREFDTVESNPQRKGINITLGNEPGLANKRISLTLTQVPLGEVLRSVASLAGVPWHADDFVVTLGGATAEGVLITRTFRVPPDFIKSTPTEGGAAENNDPFNNTNKGAESGLKLVRMSALDYLRQNGVSFGEGASAFFNPSSSTLTVRNTANNMDLVQSLVDQAANEVPQQIKVRVVFLEVDQDNLKEVGFDWLLGEFNVGGERAFGTGGTNGNAANGGDAALAADFPLAPPVTPPTPVGRHPVTAGLRSGTAAVAPNSIDALIKASQGATSTAIKAPATMALSGVFTDPQFQLVLRSLNQKKAADMASSPIITAKSGQRAKVQVIREFPYPTEFEPPQIPQDVGNNTGRRTGIIVSGPPPINYPITPTTPTAFETKNLGYELELEATVGPDKRTIDLTLAPTFSQFDGMINYGSPILVYPNGPATPLVLTENRIPQPVFSKRGTQGTNVTLWSGSTVVFAGLQHQELTTVKDKTPLFGDLPFVGRFFRSDVERVHSKAIIFMVTAEVIDPTGAAPQAPSLSTASTGQ